MTARILIATVTTAAVLSSCSLFKKDQDSYDTGANPYDVPGYDTSGAETGTYSPEGSEPVNPPANPTYSPAAYEETAPAAPRTPPAGATAKPTSGATAKVHTIGPKDTLWGLSKQYGVSIDAIKAANNMTKDTVVLGTKIKIPAR